MTTIARILLESMQREDLCDIARYYQVPTRRGKKTIVDGILKKTGRSLEKIVITDPKSSPVRLRVWREIIREKGGRRVNSYESARRELEFLLNPVFVSGYSPSVTVAQVRDDKKFRKQLGKFMGHKIDEFFSSRLSQIHGKLHIYRLLQRMSQIDQIVAREEGAKVIQPSVYSSRLGLKGAVANLHMASFAAGLSESDEVCLTTAYYDVAVVQDLLHKLAGKVRKVRLLVGALGGCRLDEQKRELIELKNAFSGEFDSFDVRLASSPGIFHTKLYLAKRGNEVTAFVGSANLSGAALIKGANEELLIEVREHDVLLEYFNHAWENIGKVLSAKEDKVYGLPDFFRTGVLYYRPYTVLPVTLNPFLQLDALMTKEERKELKGLDLPHSDHVGKIPAFNIVRALKTLFPDEEAVRALELHGADNEEEKAKEEVARSTKVKLKAYSVETYLGHWVPSELVPELNRRIDSASENKRAMYKRLLHLLQSESLKIQGAYAEYLDAAKKEIDQRAPGLLYRAKREGRNALEVSRFNELSSRIVELLSKEGGIEHFSSVYLSGVMPEIWSDQKASEDFYSSFFGYVFNVTVKSRKDPKVPAAIMRVIPDSSVESADQIKRDFELCLAKGIKVAY